MYDDEVLLVRRLSLFSSLSDEDFDNLLKMAYLQRFPEHVQLVTEGDHAEFLYVVVEGMVELFGSLNDRETTLFILRPVSTFYMSAVVEDAVYPMSARTLDAARVLMIPASDVRKVMDVNAAFAYAMASELAKRYRAVIRSLKEHRLRSGTERLANYLLRAHERAPGKGQVELLKTKRTLAALLGLTPEYLSRALGALSQYGVEVEGSKITLTNLNVLKNFAKPNPLVDGRKKMIN